MTRAKYLGRMNDGQVDLMISNRFWSHAAGFASRGRSPVCLNVSASEVSERMERSNQKRKENLLLESIIDVIHCPSAIPQMSTNGMSKIITLHNVSKGVHPSFQTTVNQRSVFGDSVDSISTYFVSFGL